MLIHFIVKNYRSINDELKINMRPGKGSRLNEHKGEYIDGVSALRSALIFGPNASGKSNILKAIELGQTMLLRGTNNCRQRLYDPYRLGDRRKMREPTKFEYAIQTGGTNYRYGFTYDANRIHEEWLYEFNRRTEKKIFSRETSSEGQSFDIEYLKKLNDEKQRAALEMLAMYTPLNQLHLREYIERPIKESGANIDCIMNVVKWFREHLEVLSVDAPMSTHLIGQMAREDKIRKIFCSLLSSYDTGIKGIDFKTLKIEDVEMPSELKTDIVNDLMSEYSKSKVGDDFEFGAIVHNRSNIFLFQLDHNHEPEIKKLQIIHKVDFDNRSEYFDPNDESDGTNYIFKLIPVLIDMLVSPKVYIIDEFGHNLHSFLTKRLVADLLKIGEKTNSQFICTTHEVGLLDQDKIRKDEVWFVSKNDDNSSEIHSLEEYPVRFDKRIREAYLKGSFNALPTIAENGLENWMTEDCK